MGSGGNDGDMVPHRPPLCLNSSLMGNNPQSHDKEALRIKAMKNW
jgi:hypothetical protein